MAQTRPAWWLAIIGLLLIVGGSIAAYQVRSDNGIAVRDIRFTGASGARMSALLYVPRTATPATPAPGILAVHGYLNSRETQDGFALEFARRGYVVLAIDQRGHGYSDGPAFADGFGGPDALAYLRSLPMVDRDQIGMEGHSMGGWTVLAAAAAMPDGYRSMVLQGSSTGAPFAADGTRDWPRNLALVFSRYDEFSDLMWGVPRAADVGQAPKMQALFGTTGPVVADRLYGDIAAGTARMLHQPATTHPGDHFSRQAIGHATDWFARTLVGGTPRPASDQSWLGQELATGAALIGFVLLILGSFDLWLRLPLFATLRGTPTPGASRRDGRWWRRFAAQALIPVALFFPVFGAVYLFVPPSMALPQTVTTQVMLWAALAAGIAWLASRRRWAMQAVPAPQWLPSLLLAGLTIAVGYAALAAVHMMFALDFRLWIVAVKPPSMWQWIIATIYALPMTLPYLVTMRALCGDLTVAGDGPAARMAWGVAALAGGFMMMLAVDYAVLFTTGILPTAIDPLSSVIAIQFTPVLSAVAIIGLFTWARTGSHRPGAILCGLLVTLYVVAGTATQI